MHGSTHAVPAAQAGDAGPVHFILEARAKVPRRLSHPSRKTIGDSCARQQGLCWAARCARASTDSTTLSCPAMKFAVDPYDIEPGSSTTSISLSTAVRAASSRTTVIDLTGKEAVVVARAAVSRRGRA